MNNLNSRQWLSDAAMQQANNQLIMQQRDQQLTVEHRRSWQVQHLAVFVDAPQDLRQAVRTAQQAIDRRATDLTQQATVTYKAAMTALKDRYHEGEFTRDYLEQEEHRLHRQWNERRLEIADVFAHKFADTNLAQAQETAYVAATEAADAVWAVEGKRILALFRLPADPDWAAAPDVTEQDITPARRRSRAAR